MTESLTHKEIYTNEPRMVWGGGGMIAFFPSQPQVPITQLAPSVRGKKEETVKSQPKAMGDHFDIFLLNFLKSFQVEKC